MKQLIMLALAVMLGAYFCGHSLMNSLAGEVGTPLMEKYYTSIEIKNGDSLWSIADQYVENSGMSTAQYVQELRSMNRLREDTIHSGQYLTVAYFVQSQDQ